MTNDNNINISGGNVHIHGGIQQGVTSSPTKDPYGRLLVTAERSVLKKTPMTAGWSISIGAAGLLFGIFGNISSIFSANPDHIPSFLIKTMHYMAAPTLGICAVLLLMGLYLKISSKSVGLSFIGNLERGDDGFLYFSRVVGTCPVCGGLMRMIGATKNNDDHTLICNRNPQHRFLFDMTSLPEVSEEYSERTGRT